VTTPSIAPGTLLARVEDIADPGVIVVDAGVRSVLITRAGAVITAFHNRCPHAGYPLQRADGRVLVQEGRYIVCGAHGASYVLDSGACAGGPCNGEALTRIAVEIRNGEIRAA
jgi:nitrite reductase/ring-hydroxylating ferredoxin subunit